MNDKEGHVSVSASVSRDWACGHAEESHESLIEFILDVAMHAAIPMILRKISSMLGDLAEQLPFPIRFDVSGIHEAHVLEVEFL